MDEANAKVRVIPGADSGVLMPGKRWQRRLLTLEEYCGWADRMYAQGADGVYLFNLFQHPTTGSECAWAFK